MGKYEFFEGQELSQIWWKQGEAARVGHNSVVSIKVCMECGQMAGVPWAIVFYENGRATKYNLALVSGVELALHEENNNG